MIIFLYGQDTYRSRQEMKRIIEEHKKASPGWFDLNRIDCRDNGIEVFEGIRKSINTVSMFGQNKLIVIENVFDLDKEAQEELLKVLKNISDINIVLWDEESDKKNKLFKFLNPKSKEFKLLEGFQLKNWIKNYISQQKGKIENLAVEKLIEYIGKDLWRMANELNKLISFKIRDTKYEIRVGDVELLVKPEIDLNIFELVDALGHRNKNRALNLFKQYLEKGEDESYLLSMFIYQIRNLIKLKSGGRLDMHPFVIKKTRQQARNFSFEELKKIYYHLMTIDFNIKTGRVDPKTALELWVVGL